MKTTCSIILLVLLLFASTSLAAISLKKSGSVPEAFEIHPPPVDWASRSIEGGASTFSDRSAFHAAVQTNEASVITNALMVPFGGGCCAALAIWATNNVAFPQTAMLRVGGVAASLLMATVRNDTGVTLSNLTIAHEFDTTAFTLEEFGILLYYSFTGESNSWQFVHEYTNSVVTGMFFRH